MSQAWHVGTLARKVEPEFEGDTEFELAAFAGIVYPITQHIEKRLDPIGADHLYNKRGIRDELPLGFPAFCRFPLTPWAPQSRASSTVPHDLYDSQARKLFASADDQNQSQSLEYIHLSVDVSVDELVALGRWSPPM